MCPSLIFPLNRWSSQTSSNQFENHVSNNAIHRRAGDSHDPAQHDISDDAPAEIADSVSHGRTGDAPRRDLSC